MRIIIQGPQGCGKTEMANRIREILTRQELDSVQIVSTNADLNLKGEFTIHEADGGYTVWAKGL